MIDLRDLALCVAAFASWIGRSLLALINQNVFEKIVSALIFISEVALMVEG